MGQVYLCKNCRYRGTFVLEVDDDEADDKGRTEPEK